MDEPSPLFAIVKNCYVLAFVLLLEVQTWSMNKLSSALIAILSLKVFVSLFVSLSIGVLWLEFVLGWILSFFAFYVAGVELTNQVYHREMLPVYKWNDDSSSGEFFGARGKSGTLQSKAKTLRQANYVSPSTLRNAAKDESIGMTETESKKTF